MPDKMPDQYAIAIREMIQAKIENRAPEVVVATEGKPAVVNIMAALKESMQAKGRAKVRDAVRSRGLGLSQPLCASLHRVLGGQNLGVSRIGCPQAECPRKPPANPQKTRA